MTANLNGLLRATNANQVISYADSLKRLTKVWLFGLFYGGAMIVGLCFGFLTKCPNLFLKFL